MTRPEGEQVTSSGWSAAGFTNALKNRETCLTPLDPFANIDPLVSEASAEQDDSNTPNRRRSYSKHLSSENEKDSYDSEVFLKFL